MVIMNFLKIIFFVFIIYKTSCLEIEVIEICTDLSYSSRFIQKFLKQECQKISQDFIDLSSPHFALTIRIHHLSVFGGLINSYTNTKNQKLN